MSTRSLNELNQHRSRLFGLAYRMLGSKADAEDVLQDVEAACRQMVHRACERVTAKRRRFQIHSVATIDTDGERIQGFYSYSIANPDKLSSFDFLSLSVIGASAASP